MTLPILNPLAILPQIVLVVAACLILLLDLAVRNKRILGWLSIAAALLALAALIFLRPATPAFQPATPLKNMALDDGLAMFGSIAILIAVGLALLISIDPVAGFTRRIGAYYALMLLAAAGMIAMVTASDFMTMFVALEILSLALYILVGFYRHDLLSGEAALKYFLLGAFASGFFLYGIALIYGATGATNLAQISMNLATQSASLPSPGGDLRFAPLLPIGVGLLIVGFGFKVALVPFHQWTPDVYQGAPTTVTAFMSVATKAAVFTALIRVLAALIAVSQPWFLVLAVLAAVTMTLGNLAALRQTSVKRMLAYSSIAHAGYIATGLAAGTAQGAQAALYYLLAYTFMNLGAFAVVLAIQRPDADPRQGNENDVTMDQIAGLGSREPGLAALLALFMFGLTGIPPLAGFFGKLYVFGAAVDAGLVWLAVIGVINSGIAAFYYLRVTVAMFMTPGETVAGEEPGFASAPRVSGLVTAAIILTAVGTVLLGLWQQPWVNGISQAVASLIP
jgi:NADH-quinone oxidoreductase subunit N